MKKLNLAVSSVLLGSLIIFSGCSDSNENNNDGDTGGGTENSKYDLTDYMIPDSSATYLFSADGEIVPIVMTVDDESVELDFDGYIETYTASENSITIVEKGDGGENTFTRPRYVSVGETFQHDEDVTCEIKEHQDSMTISETEYNDVLSIYCENPDDEGRTSWTDYYSTYNGGSLIKHAEDSFIAEVTEITPF